MPDQGKYSHRKTQKYPAQPAYLPWWGCGPERMLVSAWWIEMAPPRPPGLPTQPFSSRGKLLINNHYGMVTVQKRESTEITLCASTSIPLSRDAGVGQCVLLLRPKASTRAAGEADAAGSPAVSSRPIFASAGLDMQWNWGSIDGSVAHLRGQQEGK